MSFLVNYWFIYLFILIYFYCLFIIYTHASISYLQRSSIIIYTGQPSSYSFYYVRLNLQYPPTYLRSNVNSGGLVLSFAPHRVYLPTLGRTSPPPLPPYRPPARYGDPLGRGRACWCGYETVPTPMWLWCCLPLYSIRRICENSPRAIICTFRSCNPTLS